MPSFQRAPKKEARVQGKLNMQIQMLTIFGGEAPRRYLRVDKLIRVGLLWSR